MFDDDRDAVIARALSAGIDRILTVGTDLVSSIRAVELAGRYEPVFAAVGIDPHHADTFATDGPKVRDLLDRAKVVAVGEIGLDYERSAVSTHEQQDAFRTQLRWAHERGLAVSVHNRGADRDAVAMLRDASVRAVFHCFSGDEALVRKVVDAGWYASFAGNVTFQNADALRTLVALVPVEQLLVESDAPVLAPQPWRGRRNEPGYLSHTLGTVATAHRVDAQQLSAHMTTSTQTLFRWGTA